MNEQPAITYKELSAMTGLSKTYLTSRKIFVQCRLKLPGKIARFDLKKVKLVARSIGYSIQ